jgi:inner membrane protein COX18
MKLHYSKTIGEAALMNKLFMRSEDNVRELQKESQERISEWYKKWKIPRTSIAVVPLIQLPVWATMMEGIRHICGVEMGLFRYFSPANAIHGPQVQGLSGAEPTLASEGTLWFSDLLAGDSTGILPLMLTFSILGNLRGSIATKTFAEASDLEKPQMIVQIFLKFTKYFGQAFAFYIGLMAYLSGMPTGLLLYWITSTNVATLQTLFVNNYLFVNKPMTAARQMHIRVLKPGEKPPPVKKLLQ